MNEGAGKKLFSFPLAWLPLMLSFLVDGYKIMYLGSLGKCVSFNYTSHKDTFTLRAWLFWYWLFSLEEIHRLMGDGYYNGYYIGIRVFGFSVQRIGR